MMKGLRASLWVWLAAVVTGASSFTLVSQVPARPVGRGDDEHHEEAQHSCVQRHSGAKALQLQRPVADILMGCFLFLGNPSSSRKRIRQDWNGSKIPGRS